MTNAKQELLSHIEGKHVFRVEVNYESFCDVTFDGVNTVIKGDLDTVLPLLDFEYDSGFGSQNLYGYIWYTDGTWSERDEYDGSEWWATIVRPEPDMSEPVEANHAD